MNMRGDSDTVSVFFPPLGQFTGSNLQEAGTIDTNFGNCLMGIQTEVGKHGIGLLLNELSEDFLKNRRYIDMVRSKQIGGILLWGVLEEDEYVHELLAEGIPLVMVQTKKENCACSSVVADDYQGMAQLTEKVLGAGHRRIAIAGPYERASSGTARMKGILDTLRKAGANRRILPASGVTATPSGCVRRRRFWKRRRRSAASWLPTILRHLAVSTR